MAADRRSLDGFVWMQSTVQAATYKLPVCYIRLCIQNSRYTYIDLTTFSSNSASPPLPVVSHEASNGAS